MSAPARRWFARSVCVLWAASASCAVPDRTLEVASAGGAGQGGSAGTSPGGATGAGQGGSAGTSPGGAAGAGQGGSAGTSPGGASGGAGMAGTAGLPLCNPPQTSDLGFEGSLTTPVGSWTVTGNHGLLQHVTEYRQAGTDALLLQDQDTTHNQSTTEAVQIDFSGREVNSVRFYNIADYTIPTYSWWCWASVSAVFSDGVNIDRLDALRQVPWGDGSCPCNVQNATNAACTITGADGRTWYRYDFDIPTAWNHNSITLELIVDADGGDSAVDVVAKGWFDVVEVSP